MQRTVLACLTAALACLTGAVLQTGGAAAQAAYPSRPIELVVAYAPGGATDIIGRFLAARMQEKLGQPVVVENRAGATGQVGSQYVAHAKPDGYTLQIAVQTTHAVAPTFYGNIGYDPIKDFTPIVRAVGSPLVLVVNPKLGVSTLDGLIAYIKERPGKVSYATGGTGDGSHLAGLFFNNMTGLDPVYIPHQGEGPALPQVIGGHLPYMFVLVPTAAPFIDARQIIPLAVTGEKRSPRLPGVPTMAEAGLKGYWMETWWGVFGPARMPPDVVARLNTTLNAILKEPDTAAKINGLGYEVRGSTPEEFAAFVVEENKKWAKVITEQGLAGKARK
jgi:tripartite-type tricarboxylate transporter receptor subunit TctC